MVFQAANDRFTNPGPLLAKFMEAVGTVLQRGRGFFRGVDEAHNELCIAHAILTDQQTHFTRLEYEPPIPGSAKTIDFLTLTDTGLTVFVDVKTIKPLPTDRWEQYQRALDESWFPRNVNVLLSQRWLGGEFWHQMFSARSRMLEYALELEQKIAEGKLQRDGSLFILALCGESLFSWREDELEDFVAFYQAGRHRNDDPFSQAEDKYIADQHILLTRAISRFACMRRPQGEILPKRLNWNVQPPSAISFSLAQ